MARAVPVLGYGQQHLLDEAGIHHGGLHAVAGRLGDDERGDLGLDLRHGLLAGQRDFGQGVLLHVLRLRLGALYDRSGLGLSLGHDFSSFGLRFGNQAVRLRTPLLQTLGVERPGQLFQFILHKCYCVFN